MKDLVDSNSDKKYGWRKGYIDAMGILLKFQKEYASQHYRAETHLNNAYKFMSDYFHNEIQENK